jgi:hypothetical protein
MPQVRTCYASIEELMDDFAMTFQVALMGKYGLVLGSDRLHLERGLAGFMKRRTPHQTTRGSKIHVSYDEAVICAFAGGPNSETIARRIATECSPRGLSNIDWRNSLEAVAKSVSQYEEHILDEVLVIRADNRSILKLMRQQRDDPTFTPVDSAIFSGIDSDARAIPKLFWRDDLTTDELTTLAIVSIDYARQEFPNMVGGGADIVAVDYSGKITQRTYSGYESARICESFVDRAHRTL